MSWRASGCDGSREEADVEIVTFPLSSIDPRHPERDVERRAGVQWRTSTAPVDCTSGGSSGLSTLVDVDWKVRGPRAPRPDPSCVRARPRARRAGQRLERHAALFLDPRRAAVSRRGTASEQGTAMTARSRIPTRACVCGLLLGRLAPSRVASPVGPSLRHPPRRSGTRVSTPRTSFQGLRRHVRNRYLAWPRPPTLATDPSRLPPPDFRSTKFSPATKSLK